MRIIAKTDDIRNVFAAGGVYACYCSAYGLRRRGWVPVPPVTLPGQTGKQNGISGSRNACVRQPGRGGILGRYRLPPAKDRDVFLFRGAAQLPLRIDRKALPDEAQHG